MIVRMFKKIMIIAMCAIFSIVAFGCGGNGADSEYSMRIYFWRSGLGDEFINKIIDDFEQDYPQYKIIFDQTTWVGTISNNFGLEEADQYDLWMWDNSPIVGRLAEYGEPMDDILSDYAYGETDKTIGEKIQNEILPLFKDSCNQYHSLPYGGGFVSLVYNADIIGTSRYPLPKTTDELDVLTGALKRTYKNQQTGQVYMNSSNGGYWEYIYNVWQAQYDGRDYYLNNFLPLKDDSGNINSKSVILKADGRRKALDVLESILTPDTVATGSNAFTFTEAQTKFLNKKAVMMANGAWLMNEMKSTSVSGNYAMMKIPVISSIIDKCPSIADDGELSALIAAVDENDTAEAVPLSGTGYSVSRADANRVYEARNLLFTSYNSSAFIIPKYSKKKEIAKTFIKYYYSDKCLKTYFDCTKMKPVASLTNIQLDTTGMSSWEKTLFNFGSTSIPLNNATANRSVLFINSSCRPYANIDIITKISHASTSERKTAAQLWQEIYNTLDYNWDSYLRDAKLK